MIYELLVSEDKRSYFINCQSNNGILEVGAVFIAPSSSSPIKLVAENGAKLTLTLPPEAANQDTEMVAAETSFLIDL
tara:strand:+ start:1000 stop:1230 length:231 start_codon:yes stop_codon:yes gene_type:complete